jgi:phospholipase C
VLGPTDPNRLYWISGTIDPDGQHGGPLLYTPQLEPSNVFSWKTYPEALQEAGVSWKAYTSNEVPIVSGAVLSSMLGAFKNFQDRNSELYKRGIAPTFPASFKADVKNNTLPAVSWVIPGLLECEHPALPPALGAQGILQVLNILTSNPAVWEKTALIISYDENGGFFDHVPPPVAPPGTPGEYLTVPLPGVMDSAGIAGPIGLGFRVPGLVLSPYTRGGLVASEVFDHTSQLRLAETRFGVQVPNLSAWRRSVVGDMTSAFNFAAAPRNAKPTLPGTGLAVTLSLLECRLGVDALIGTFFSTNNPFHYPVPPNSMPHQETTPHRGTPSGPVSSSSAGFVSAAAADKTISTKRTAKPAPRKPVAVPVEVTPKGRSRVAGHVDRAQDRFRTD